ncbi:MAG: hypothetical protein JO316_09440 [Abitibacteriaceae bacterium]|nr:hypothetical protein [Abditibacteriaceae bacterium]
MSDLSTPTMGMCNQNHEPGYYRRGRNARWPNKVLPLLAFTLFIAIRPVRAVALPAQAILWSTDIVHQPNFWQERMNDAQVSVQASGLQIKVAPGREWAIAAVSHVWLPKTVGIIRVRVSRLAGGGRWLVRLHGNIRGQGVDADYGPFQGETRTGLQTLEIDPRLLHLNQHPMVQVQLGLEGPPGAAVDFASLEFLPNLVDVPAPRVIPGQRNLEAVDLMPNLPQPFHIINWRERALNYDRFVFDFQRQGQYLPLIWLDNSQVNNSGPAFGLCSYVGDKRQGTSQEEGINCMGAVLGATLVGIDKSHQEHDYVRMCQAFYNSQHGSNLVLNGTNTEAGGSFWYDIWPHIIFYALADRYRQQATMPGIVQATANRWYDAYGTLGGSNRGTPNFDHTAFNFKTMQPVDNGHWKEPDAAAGVAWLQYAAWNRFRDAKYLQAAEGSLRFLEQRQNNPYYEVLLPWGALTAARLNAELERHYNVDKLLNWSFGISDCRGGWGVTTGRWGDYNCAGLVGSVDNRGGYAFAMNTFVQAAALVPLVRYDPHYARAIGKWMLNLANAARLFYPDGLPVEHQSPPLWREDAKSVIAYEGLRREWQGQSPCATGDPVVMKWGPATDRGLYGSSYVGILGAIVGRTSDAKILALDCLATDFYRQPAYPTKLCYNPYPQQKQIILSLDTGRYDVYDAVSQKFLLKNVTNRVHVTLAADSAKLVVLAPAHGKVARLGHKLLINGVVVDYGVAA